jgi:electron transfer flavoprotein alpha subunit
MILVMENKMGRTLLELVGKAVELSKKSGMKVGVVLIGHDFSKVEDLFEYGVDEIHVAENEKLSRFSLDPFLKISLRIVGEIDPEIIIAPANSFGRTLMPAIAAKLKTGLTADCTELDFDDDGRFLQTRPAIGGNIMATIVIPNHRPKMATVRPRVFEPAKKQKKKSGVLKKWTPSLEDLHDRCELVSFTPKEDEVNIQEADVIVSVGKGLRKKENVEVAKKLAKLVGGAVGATRAVVDAKWLSHEHQVGLSGKTVNPRVYIAAGISGAVQHIAGMQTSEIIVAINKDKYAPIFRIADIGIVADAKSTLEEIIRRLER